ncbi:FecR domain-containing protein [Caulobacter sp. FWC2]|uniref:FecR family protein n=1 Tax=Caulobacter sp. FWC2 TaxID=69664 RepID=UPI000C156F25|nr:FecR domain-containing protein [Caulobacter sp. FWC2]PIB93998.1 iron dicitrate transport regulator FecR [Caulobacter sp. FWC2]
MNGQDLETKETLRDEAVAWLVRVQSDAATADDWSALTDWLEGSEARLAAFEEAELIVADLEGRKAEIAEALSPAPPNVVAFRPKRAPARGFWISGAIAASLAVLVGGPALWKSSQGDLVTYETRPGETRRVDLADGTRITLDGGSRLSVRLGWRQRRVEMGLAQASFDVAKDPSRPFVIGVGDERVRVVGTEFNIRHDARSVRVSVRRGIVEVAQRDGKGPPPARLTVGQELRHVQGSTGSQVRRVEPDAAFAWSQGQLVADGETLGDIVADLNRRFPTPIRIAPQAALKRFSGVIALDDQDAAIRILAAYASLTVDRVDGEIVLR